MPIIKECDLRLAELYKFSPELIDLGATINDNRLEVFANKIGFNLPVDWTYILNKHNGLSLNGTLVYGIDLTLRGASLDEVYHFEHFEVENPMPKEFLPFSPDRRGNHYCLNLSKLKNNQCPVVFWQHDFNYANIDEVEECNGSFIDWIKEIMIAWTLEEYNYDGTEK